MPQIVRIDLCTEIHPYMGFKIPKHLSVGQVFAAESSLSFPKSQIRQENQQNILSILCIL